MLVCAVACVCVSVCACACANPTNDLAATRAKRMCDMVLPPPSLFPLFLILNKIQCRVVLFVVPAAKRGLRKKMHYVEHIINSEKHCNTMQHTATHCAQYIISIASRIQTRNGQIRQKRIRKDQVKIRVT